MRVGDEAGEAVEGGFDFGVDGRRGGDGGDGGALEAVEGLLAGVGVEEGGEVGVALRGGTEGGGIEGADLTEGLEEFDGAGLVSAAEAFGLEEGPLVAGLGLLLGAEGAVVLGRGHFAGGEAGEERGDDGEDDGGGGEEFAEEVLGNVGFKLVGDLEGHSDTPWRERRGYEDDSIAELVRQKVGGRA